MKKCILATLTLLFFLSAAATARANWICGVMDPYSGYFHPSFYFPPAMVDFYACQGYESLLPGAGYAPYVPQGYTSYGYDGNAAYSYPGVTANAAVGSPQYAAPAAPSAGGYGAFDVR